jgi:prevent-host-death family protein
VSVGIARPTTFPVNGVHFEAGSSVQESPVAEVGVAQLRRELKDWLDRAVSGEEVVVTDRGRPIARLSGIGIAPLLDRLADEGRISPVARAPRPTARGRTRAMARGDVSGLVVAERDARR